MTQGLTYAQAGVDIDAGEALVDRIKPMAKSTNRPGVMGGLGGFGAFFDLKAAGFRDPVLVAGTDGVGTKLKLAIDSGILETVGVDLVAMCVNDLLCQGAQPLFFLDYYATGKLSVEAAARVISGIAEGCRQADCALIGGETAEMPGMYAHGDFDLAGFAVGAVERDTMLPAHVGVGDVLLALPSSGPHSNGYSLIRKVLAIAGQQLSDPAPFAPGKTMAQALLEPTRIYIRALRPLLAAGCVHGLAHITGGGLTENLPRILPEGVAAEIDLNAIQPPAVFGWLARQGGIAESEMLRTFNCGIGLVIVVPAARVAEARALLANEQVITLGTLVAQGDGPVMRYHGRLAL